ncbi:beta-lactamase/transpeptidase-like protein [Gamsiella multidivaricata]|uniref:beta-lactamase/transpeptidase-like protein n=1 Tax=Gamsiella multidivaricata TaxID=101098 RepID=UPI00221E75DD|nr:beta-lactamase/transpeptidase-like protein [Gamsiella multidivaricata]KAI7831404.1 beta-lactamase/transpeptidase-like protein [Gamsiella multidivaricata]
MADKEVTPPAAATAAAVPASRASFFPRLTLVQWFVRLIPAMIFGIYAYSKRGPFLPPTCASLGVNCPQAPLHLEGILERPDHYGQVINYYASLFAKNEDLGGSFAVLVDGHQVIDVYAGAKDLARTVVYDNRTLQQVYSSGKVVEGIVIARLVEQGRLDYEKRIADYWPEFAQNGKEDVRLVDLMTHESGVPFLDNEDKAEMYLWPHLADEEKFSDRLARQPHLFNGEKTRAYHAITRGWYLNEIVRRVDSKGRTIGQIAEQDLMVDYPDIELYYSKLPKDSDWEERLSVMHDYPLLRTVGRLLVPRFIQTNKYFGHPNILPLGNMFKSLVLGQFSGQGLPSLTMLPKFAPWAHDFRTKEVHAIESTSFSLKTNAHSLAKLMSMMANKGSSIRPGQEPDLMSTETYAKATAFHAQKPDEVVGETLPLSVGGWVKTRNFYGDGPLKDIEVQGWSGAGGSLCVWIEELNIGFAYVTNAFGPPETTLGDYRSRILLDRVAYARKDELGLLQKATKK